MTNNLQIIKLMANIGKNNARKSITIQLACIGLMACSVAIICYYQYLFEKAKLKKLANENENLHNVISVSKVKLIHLQQQLLYAREIIEKLSQSKDKTV